MHMDNRFVYSISLSLSLDKSQILYYVMYTEIVIDCRFLFNLNHGFVGIDT